MSNTMKASRFILMTTKSYLKRILLPFFLMFSIVLAMMSRMSHHGIQMLCFLVLALLFFMPGLFSAYSFSACDKVPQVFCVLPQKRKDLVRAFYLNFILLISGAFVIGIGVFTVFQRVGVKTDGFLFLLGLLFALFSLVSSVQLPLLLQLGYAKIQLIFNLIYVGIGYLPAILIQMFRQQTAIIWMIGHRRQLDNPLYIVGFILSALLFLLISYRISIKVYQRKDI